MKKITPFLLIIICVSAQAQTSGNSELITKKLKAKYPYSSAQIKYKLSGDATGSSVLFFDRNGWRSSEIKMLKFNRYGIESTEKVVELIDGDYVYSVNVDAGKGKKTIDKNWSSLLSYKDPAEVITILMESKGGKLSGTDSLLNRPCRIWTFEKGAIKSLWEWQGLPLKIEKKLPGLSYEMFAVSIEKDIPVAEENFTLPEGVVWD